jgi:hypothetical protein
MKLTEAKLKKVIEEEVEAMVKEGELDEGWLDRLKAQVTGDVEQLKGTTKAAALKAASKGAAGPSKAAVGGPPQPAPRVPSATPPAPQGSGTRASDE